MIIEFFQTISSLYEIGDPSTIGLRCDNGVNEICKKSMPNDEFPKKIEKDCEGQLMLSETKNDPSCLDLCKSNAVGRASTTLIRRGWTKFVK